MADENNDSQTSEQTTEQTSDQTTLPGGTPSPESQDGSPDGSPPEWREDWREALAGEDDKALRYFKRYSTPENLGKSLLSLRAKMDAGELKAGMPDPEDEKAVSEWREQNNVPPEVEGYFEDYEADDEIKAMASPYLELAHSKGMPKEDIHGWLDKMKEQQQTLGEQIAEQDAQFKRESEDDLRARYGNEYRLNLNHMANVMIPIMGEELFEEFNSARLPNGKKFADDSRVMDMFVNLSRQLEPVGTVVLPNSEQAMTAMKARKAEIEASIKDTKGGEYWTNQGMQDEYNQILQQEEKLEANRR